MRATRCQGRRNSVPALVMAPARRAFRGCLAGVTRYIEFLKAGDSIAPLDAWRLAGVEMASPAPVERAYAVLDGMIIRLEAILDAAPTR